MVTVNILFLLNYMKQGLLLTLKELLKLGIIKPKRRRKRRSNMRSSVKTISADGNIRTDENPRTGEVTIIPSTKYNDFISASQPPSQIAYTDNLRLRDEQSNFNTRLIEYKNQLENEKSLLENRQKAIEDDIDYSKQAVTNELQKLSNRIDNTDVATTFGSEMFKSQKAVNNDIYPIKDKIGNLMDESSYLSDATPYNPSVSEASPFVDEMPSEQHEEDNVSAVTKPTIRKVGRPRSLLSLKERRKQQYLLQKAIKKEEERIASEEKQKKTTQEQERLGNISQSKRTIRDWLKG